MTLNWLKYELPLGLILILPIAIFFKTTGDVSEYFRYQMPAGQTWYLISKVSGLYAIVFLWLQILQGLLSVCGHSFLNRSRNTHFHRNLGLCVLSLFICHITSFIIAVSLRNGFFSYQLLLPNFFTSYYPKIVSLGVIAAWFLLITIGVGIADGRLGKIGWVWSHRLSWAAFFLVFFHSYLIGSETRVGAMEWLYFFMFGSVITATVYRVWYGFLKDYIQE